METSLKNIVCELKKVLSERRDTSRSFRKDIRALPQTPDTGPLRNTLWNTRQIYGQTTRGHHLVYCFLRGRLYKQCEQKSRVKPFSQYLVSFLGYELERLFGKEKCKEMRLSFNMLYAWFTEGWRFDGQVLGPVQAKQPEALAAE